MKLITKKIQKALEKQGDTSELMPDKIKVIFKLFNAAGAGSWYIYQHHEGNLYWAFANLGDSRFAECGLIDLQELEELNRGNYRFMIERDTSLEPGDYTLEQVINTIKAEGHI